MNEPLLQIVKRLMLKVKDDPSLSDEIVALMEIAMQPDLLPPRKVRITEDEVDWDLIAEDYSNGLSMNAIARKYHVSQSSISTHLHKMGVEVRDAQKYNYTPPPADLPIPKDAKVGETVAERYIRLKENSKSRVPDEMRKRDYAPKMSNDSRKQQILDAMKKDDEYWTTSQIALVCGLTNRTNLIKLLEEMVVEKKLLSHMQDKKTRVWELFKAPEEKKRKPQGRREVILDNSRAVDPFIVTNDIAHIEGERR